MLRERVAQEGIIVLGEKVRSLKETTTNESNREILIK